MKKSLYGIWLIALFCFASTALQAAGSSNIIELDGIVSEINLKEKMVSLNGQWCDLTYRSKIYSFNGNPASIKDIAPGAAYLATVKSNSARGGRSSGRGYAASTLEKSDDPIGEVLELWIKQ